MLPTFGEHMSVEFIHCSIAKLSGAQLSTFLGRIVGPRTVGMMMMSRVNLSNLY